MSNNGQQNGTTHALAWPRRVLSASDLQKNLNGHREVVLPPEAVITPLASEELRTRGIAVRRQPITLPASAGRDPTPGPIWGYGQDRSHPMVQAAIQTLRREGLSLREMPTLHDLPCRWARAVAECLARGECAGSVLFCEDPGLVACVANKVPGLRAVSVCTVGQAARATLALAANLLVVEMPGRTFFEIRQILRTLCSSKLPCPEGVACTLQELDGHAHR
jgi:ribose 5-phosphate isomerase RpiB